MAYPPYPPMALNMQKKFNSLLSKAMWPFQLPDFNLVDYLVKTMVEKFLFCSFKC